MNNRNMFLGDLNAIHDSFIKNMNETLKISFNICVNHDEMEEFFTRYPTPSVPQKLDFIASQIENSKSYILVNYYLATSIGAILKAVKPEYKCACKEKLNQLGLGETAFNEIEEMYRELGQSLKEDKTT
ncbi:hypothetical protein H6764_03580 [Candidatus Nomurabacteria bacterium]|nr:hypothetical protein [Candidatus Nomurabacteria bacterium]